MRKATFAKLSLTAAVGLGTLVGQATIAHAGPPQQGTLVLDQSGDSIEDFAPAPTTTVPHFPGVIVHPEDPEPDPPFDPDLPIAQPEADDCDFPCDKAPVPQDPEPECNPMVLCDEITSDPGCTWTHGCEPDPECNPMVLCDEITSDPGCNVTHGDCDEGTDDGGTDGGTDGETDDGGDEGTTDDGTTGGTTDGGGSDGGSLPRTGAELATWAIAGLGLTGVGAALKKLGKHQS